MKLILLGIATFLTAAVSFADEQVPAGLDETTEITEDVFARQTPDLYAGKITDWSQNMICYSFKSGPSRAANTTSCVTIPPYLHLAHDTKIGTPKLSENTD